MPFLPGDGNEMDDDDPPEFDDVAADFENDCTEKWNITGLDCETEFVRRKYAFGIKGIPREETNWLEAYCDFPRACLGLVPPSERLTDYSGRCE